jgi:hypothetical protein
MSAQKLQAIAGVSAGMENIIMVQYPSVAATGIGRLIGSIAESIPVPVFGPKLSHLLFGLPLAPLGALAYLALKVGGERYVLTNRSLERWKMLGSHLLQEVPLPEIAEIEIVGTPSQAFYKAADLHVLNAAGNTIMELHGVKRPDVFRRIILEARDARAQTEASLARIRARQPA